MKLSILTLALLILAAICHASSAVEANATPPAQTYTVLVGGNDSAYGAELQSFFPQNLTIRVGDTVVWQQNTSDIHTVTFTPGMAEYPSSCPFPTATAA